MEVVDQRGDQGGHAELKLIPTTMRESTQMMEKEKLAELVSAAPIHTPPQLLRESIARRLETKAGLLMQCCLLCTDLVFKSLG